jgi:hypothetical protein
MYRFWEFIIKPVFEIFNVKNIVEIGSKGGNHTEKMIEYCSSKNGFLHCIDPFPQYDYKKLETEFSNHFKQYVDLSLNVLRDLKNIDAVLIDGDHNWYTVYHELKLIDSSYDKFPLVFFHDIGWPYGRRDLYYNPEDIPQEYRHEYLKKGIIPNQSELSDDGINSHLLNAVIESNEKNGVLTAIEDFISHSNKNLVFYNFDVLNGLGLLIPEEFNKKIVDSGMFNHVYPNLLSIGEKERIDFFVKNMVLNNKFINLQDSYKELKEKFIESNERYKQKIAKQSKNTNKLKNTISQKNKIISNKSRVISNKTKLIHDKNRIINQYEQSLSWKITKPIRATGRILRKILYNPYI